MTDRQGHTLGIIALVLSVVTLLYALLWFIGVV